jgi:hypothetical protein
VVGEGQRRQRQQAGEPLAAAGGGQREPLAGDEFSFN